MATSTPSPLPPLPGTDPILDSLSRASLAVLRTLDPEEIFSVVSDELKEFGLDSTFLLLTESRDELYVAHLSYNTTLIRAAEKIAGLRMKDTVFPLSNMPTYRKVIAAAAPLYVDDPVAETRQFLPEGRFGDMAARIAALFRLRTSIIAPLYRQNVIIGVLAVSGESVVPGYLPAISAFANTVSIAMDNARLYAELKDSATHLEQLVAARTRELTRTTRYLENIIDSSGVAIIVMDMQGRFSVFNRGAEELTGYTAAELIGKRLPPDFLVANESQDAGPELQTSGKAENKEATIRRKDGTRVTVEYFVSQLFDDDGAPTALLALAIDRSAQRTLLSELVRAERLAGVGQLASGLTHEFNNIIAGLRGYAQLAQLPGKDHRMKELPEMVLSLTDRASEIVERLQSFSSSAEEAPHPVDVAVVIKETVSLTERDLIENDITVHLDVENCVAVMGNAGLLSQVFLNLITNARHAMPDGGRLTITGRTTPATVEITCTDTGQGIPETDLARVFDPFFTTKGAVGGSETPGIGLGLSMCYRIIGDLGGTISVASAVGRGTTFTIALKRASPEDQAAPPSETPPPRPAGDAAGDVARAAAPETPGASLHVLLAEDEPAIRESVTEYLHMVGYTVHPAESGAEAVDVMRRESIDVAILDVSLRTDSGLALAQELRARAPDLPLVLVTGLAGQELEAAARRAQELGIQTIVSKPFLLTDLVEAVDRTHAAVAADTGRVPATASSA